MGKTYGHVNVSPKGHADTFTILDEQTVAYLDLTGSGAEAVAHLRDNGWTAGKDDAALAAYRTQRNHKSIDGLPALPMAAGDRRRAWAESGLTSCRLQQECSLETVDRS